MVSEDKKLRSNVPPLKNCVYDRILLISVIILIFFIIICGMYHVILAIIIINGKYHFILVIMILI